MEKKKIPLPYKIILKKFWRDSDLGKIEIHRARLILSHTIRFGKEYTSGLIREMKGDNLIDCSNKRYFQINVLLKDLI